MRYQKGARAERELIKMFLDKGFAVIRAAGSGVNSNSPDILVFKKGVQYAFECKAWNKDYLSIEKEKVKRLIKWEKTTGITTMIAWKIPYDGWFFVYPQEMSNSAKYCSISKNKIKQINRVFDNLV